jgi:glycosyltransferase involved in cell wall biosynthesis
VIVYDTPENREVVGDCGLFFKDADELTAQLQRAMDDPIMVVRFRESAQARAKALYSWDAVTDQYEKLFIEMMATK